jgi:hypothetical protein
MQIPEAAHYWGLFVAGHGPHVLKRASLSVHRRFPERRAEWNGCERMQ